jgi:hypothetical protein
VTTKNDGTPRFQAQAGIVVQFITGGIRSPVRRRD